MSIIKILSENLVNQIAAGEVIERPASVLKELVENSLDSASDRIIIELKDAGKTLIKVSDNGFGIAPDDIELSVARHATSKISEEKDLWNISTMGFRGEALASISAISQLTLRSKIKTEISGREINCEGGEIMNIREIGMSDGTQVEVRNLFFNTPARQKYLKKDATELGQITAMLNATALANYDVSFKLIHNEKIIFDLPKATDLNSRIADLFGKATSESMIPVFYGGLEVKIDGFVGKPLLARSTSGHQYFFVNKRPIQHFLLANTIKEAFHSLLMENKKPVFVINITIDPALIDVNVHPRKLEIRFEDQKNILRVMYGSVKTALEKNNLAPSGTSFSGSYMSDKAFDEKHVVRNFGEKSIQDALDFSKNFLMERENKIINERKEKEEEFLMRAVSQVANSYIVAQDENGLVLIDQHAAHERVRYEELMDQFENEKKSIQPLLVGMQVELSSDENILVEENMKILEKLGFEIENFGGKTFLVNAVPAFLAKEDIETVIKGVLDDILQEKWPSKFQGKTEEIINYMACRSAIKFGQSLSLSEMQILITKLGKLKRPYTCPHGRPTMISLSLSELEKMFGRK